MVFILSLRQCYQLALGAIYKPVLENKHLVASFRCWPVDMDMMLHMNNASYVRVAELASWRLLPQINFVSKAFKNKWALVVVEQNVVYKKSIRPFQKYEVLTNVTIEDTKWLRYRHIFRQHKDDVKPNQEPIVFATVDKKGVVKDRAGKTVLSDQYSLDIFS